MEVFMDESGMMYRYKYRDMHPDSLKIITDGTLYFASPLDFNDPFDSSPAYVESSVKGIFKLRPDLVRAAGNAMGLSPAKRLMHKGQMITKLKNAIQSGDWAKGLLGSHGIFCVSRTPCNPLMWAHYADEYKGFVVEFSISTESPPDVLKASLPIPVRYSETRPLLKVADREVRTEDYFLTKSPDWAYEQEERIFQNDGGPGVYPYSRHHLLSSIIAGARISDADFESLKRAVQQAEKDVGKPIPLYRARLSPTKYAVIIPGHPNPQFSGDF